MKKDDDAFAYITADGRTILVEEIGREIQEKLQKQSIDLEFGAAISIVKGARQVTEAIAQGHLCNNPDHFLDHLKAALKSYRLLLPEQLLKRALEALLQTLSALDISRVQYFSA